MKTDLFMHEARQTGAVFGRKHDVEVVFKGKNAETNGSTIVLPNMPVDVELPEEDVNVMRGYVDHEAGHVRHTDMAAYNAGQTAFRALPDKRVGKLGEALMNAMEDVRLERKVIDAYPGAASNLGATAERVNSLLEGEIAELPEDKRDHLGVIGPVALTWAGRREYGGGKGRELFDALPEDKQEILREAAAWSASADSTKAVVKQAMEFASRWVKYEEDEDKGPGDPEVGDGEGEGEGEGGLMDGADGGEGEGDGDAGKGIEVEGPDPIDADGKSALEDVIKDHKLDEDGPDQYFADTRFDSVHHRKRRPDSYPSTDGVTLESHGTAEKPKEISQILANGDPQRYMDQRSKLGAHVSVVRAKLVRTIMGMQNRDWFGGVEQGRLDAKRLVSAAAGKSTVFKRREDRPEIDTAVTIMVDLSGSMCGTKVQVANQCAIVLAEALEPTGAAVEVMGFTNAFNMPHARMDETIFRVETLDNIVFKSFDETLVSARGAMATIVRFADGNNTDGELIQVGWDRLRKRPETRKIMLVLSDGAPCAFRGRGAGSYRSHLEKVVREIEAKAKVVGIGIRTDSVDEFYTNSVCVSDVSELSGVALTKLAECLIGERGAARITGRAAA